MIYLLEILTPDDRLGYLEVTAYGEIINNGINPIPNGTDGFTYPRRDQIALRALIDGVSEPIIEFTTNDTDAHGQSGLELIQEYINDNEFHLWFSYLIDQLPAHN